MSKDVKGVFVRLPLSEDQKTCFYSRHYTGDPTPGLIAIGTPVAGGELEPLAYVNAERLKWKIATNKDVCLSFSGTPNPSSGTLNLVDGIVLYADHQAALAAAQAEIARLRDYLETARSYLQESPSVTARRGALDVIEEALKGPAA